jgi:predicted amidophosphoribosyltransferase
LRVLRHARPPYIATVAALVYAHPADHLLRQLKYRGRLASPIGLPPLASAVRARLEARMPGEHPERVVALPLPARQRERGFNQAGKSRNASRARWHCHLHRRSNALSPDRRRQRFPGASEDTMCATRSRRAAMSGARVSRWSTMS